MNTPEVAITINAVVLLVGWVAHKAWVKYAPSEKALALKAGIKAAQKLAALKSSAPQDIAAAAAVQAEEAALTQSLKDAVAKLS